MNTVTLSLLKTPSINISTLLLDLALKRLQLLMLKYKNCFAKGFLRRLPPVMVSACVPFFSGKIKDGSYRLIVNLKGLNAKLIMCYSVHEDKLLHVAYYTVPVAEHRKYLQIFCGNRLLQYTCLPNGLASAPR